MSVYIDFIRTFGLNFISFVQTTYTDNNTCTYIQITKMTAIQMGFRRKVFDFLNLYPIVATGVRLTKCDLKLYNSSYNLQLSSF